MKRNGDLLESGVYEDNYYGTPMPPADPPSSSWFPAFPTSPSSMPQGATGHTARAAGEGVIIPKNPDPLPPNWEMAYTEYNEKYFIELVLLCVVQWGAFRMWKYRNRSLLNTTNYSCNLVPPHGFELAVWKAGWNECNYHLFFHSVTAAITLAPPTGWTLG